MLNKKNILSTTNLFIGYISKKKSTCVAKNVNLNLARGKLIALIGEIGRAHV